MLFHSSILFPFFRYVGDTSNEELGSSTDRSSSPGSLIIKFLDNQCHGVLYEPSLFFFPLQLILLVVMIVQVSSLIHQLYLLIMMKMIVISGTHYQQQKVSLLIFAIHWLCHF